MSFRLPFTATMVGVVGMLVASCGASSGTDQTGADPVVSLQAADAEIDTPSPSTDAPASTESHDGSGTPVATEHASTGPPPTEPDSGEPAPSAPAPPTPTEPAPAQPAEPEVVPAAIGGRALALELASGTDLATNFLPDLVVDDVGRETSANLRNIFPADRPVLIWAWAPH